MLGTSVDVPMISLLLDTALAHAIFPSWMYEYQYFKIL